MRPLDGRLVGGYTSAQIAPVVVAAVMKSKAKNIMFCCCEIASNVDTHERDDHGAREVLVDLPRSATRLMEDTLRMPQGNAKVSLLFKIAATVQTQLRSLAYTGTLTLKGLNGVGYIVGDQPEYLSFSQEHLTRYETIQKRQAKKTVMTKDDAFLDGYVLDPTRKRSAHVLGFTMNLG